jgi:hypothetical protein
MRDRDVTADRETKGRLLDEAMAMTGRPRKSLIRSWRVGPRPIWTAAGYPWSRRLKALLPAWVPWARRRWSVAPATEHGVLAISPRQMDRRLRPHLRRFCESEQIQFTRGRPYKKDDNAHIEQKNWTHVRKLMGDVRYDTEAAVTAMNAVYADVRLLQNLFLPSVQLQRKRARRAHVRRCYDAPCTPLDRLHRRPHADPQKVATLLLLRRTLDPFELARRVDVGLDRVYRLSHLQRVRPSRLLAARPPATDRPPDTPPYAAR